MPYTRGRVLDIGGGSLKPFPHFISVDSGKDAQLFGSDMRGVDIEAEATDLSLFADKSVDAVFSSHTLEHIEDTVQALREWWRVIKPGGHLCLYLPHKDFYPNIGEDGANPDHKHDFRPADIRSIMTKVGKGGWLLVEDEERDQDDEYSFFQVYRKRTDGKFIEDPWRKPDKACLVIRYGAYGDQLISSSVLPLLKEQGWHVTYQCDQRGFDVVEHNPYIDAFWVQDKDQVPNDELTWYWQAMATRFDRVVNLSSSVEWTLLPVPLNVGWYYDPEVRHKLFNVNYLERTHDIANVPHRFDVRFYQTDEEKHWAQKMRRKIAGERPVVMLVLSGSSGHKTWPHIDTFTAWLLEQTDAAIVMVGDERCALLEEAIIQNCCKAYGYTDEEIYPELKEHGHLGLNRMLAKKLGADRIHCTSGVWSIRNTMTFATQCDVVVGPETGVMNAVCMEPNRKVVLLSHSSSENLTKHWLNTTALGSKGCRLNPGIPCHRLHYNFEHCVKIEENGGAECMDAITPKEVFLAVRDALADAAQVQAAE